MSTDAAAGAPPPAAVKGDAERERELFAGPESGPEPPFPIKLQGPVIKGFGRGSKEVSFVFLLLLHLLHLGWGDLRFARTGGV